MRMDMVHGFPRSSHIASIPDAGINSAQAASPSTYHQQLLPPPSEAQEDQPSDPLPGDSMIVFAGASSSVSAFSLTMSDINQAWTCADVHTRNDMWFCCACGFNNGLEAITPACLNCPHRLCDNCGRDGPK